MPTLDEVLDAYARSDDPVLRAHAAYRRSLGPTDAPAPAPATPPGLLARAVTFAGAVARDAAAGMPRVSDEAYAARLAVCEPCPQRLPGGTCAGCGCVLSVKARWGAETCPEGRWPTA